MKYEFCGIPPLGFNYQPPNSENFVFVADPNFVPINLQNFFGSIVTVNSFYECFYYGELGWSVSNLTIFDIAIYAVVFLLLGLLVGSSVFEGEVLQPLNKTLASKTIA